jgi:hypothetical protein
VHPLAPEFQHRTAVVQQAAVVALVPQVQGLQRALVPERALEALELAAALALAPVPGLPQQEPGWASEQVQQLAEAQQVPEQQAPQGPLRPRYHHRP